MRVQLAILIRMKVDLFGGTQLQTHWRKSWLLPVFGLILLSACATAIENSGEAAATDGSEVAAATDDLTAGPLVTTAAPLTADDWSSVPSEAFLHATHTLSPADWADKWQASLQKSMMFFRAFPGGFHKDLKTVPASRQLGRQTLCVGDAHPSNFGFQRLGGKTRFIYNDLDDAGYCPVAYDAARYFAALRLFFDDGDLTDAVLETYVDALKDPSRGVTLDKDWAPDWDQVRAKGLEQYSSGKKFYLIEDLRATSSANRSAATATVANVSWLQGWSVLDVVEIDRKSGGSGGLDRYWLLLQKGGTQTIVELKQTAQPGTEQGIHAKTLTGASRLSQLQSAMWGYAGQDALALVTLQGKTFLARDRLQRKSLDVLDLHGKERQGVLQVQASVLADLHRAAWQGVQKDAIRAWIKTSAKTLAKRWDSAYVSAGGK